MLFIRIIAGIFALLLLTVATTCMLLSATSHSPDHFSLAIAVVCGLTAFPLVMIASTDPRGVQKKKFKSARMATANRKTSETDSKRNAVSHPIY